MTLTQAATMVSDFDRDVVYFCGASEVPYGFMCQWFESPFVVNGITYATAEMWMMTMKARLFGDEVGTFASILGVRQDLKWHRGGFHLAEDATSMDLPSLAAAFLIDLTMT